MNWNDILLRARALRSRRRAESDLDDELQFHLEMEALKMRNAGLNEEDARQSARVEFGGVEQAREECRDVRGVAFLENLGRDLRYGVRMLRKSPVFTAVAVLSLGIGIGANTAVFSLVDAVLLRLLPVKNPDQLVVLKWGARKISSLSFTFTNGGRDARGRSVRNTFSWRIFEDLRARNRTLDGVIGFFPLSQLNVAANGQTLVTGGVAVSGNYFSTLGVNTLLGRPLTADDETVGGNPAAVISYRFWDRAFGLDPAVIGQTIVVNAKPCVIVGVTQKGFPGVSPGGFWLTPEVDITLPIRAGRTAGSFVGDEFWVQMMGRRAPGATPAAVEAELTAFVAADLPEAARRETTADAPYGSVESGSQGLGHLRSAYRNPLLIIMAVVGLTLLMACANLAGLLLARAKARHKEILVRLALGGKRSRLVRQLLVEGALLSVAGAAVGLAVAYAGVQALLALLASGMTPVMVQVRPDARVLAFTIAVSLLTTVLFALAPAVRATRVDVAHGLKEDTPAAGNQRFGAVRVLVAVQIAVAVSLVTGALLLERTLANLRSVPLGFNANNLVVFDIAPGRNGYDEVRGTQLYQRVLDGLRQTPGVVNASLSAQRLLTGLVSNGSVRVDGVANPAESTFNFVGPGFFDVLQIPMVAGRSIGQRDMGLTPRVAVVNETFARSYLHGEALGRRFRFKKDWDVEIVGVARDARYDSVRRELPATIYFPYTQRPWGWPAQMAVEVRTAGDRAATLAAVRRTMREIDPMLPLIDWKTQQAQVDDMLVEERLFASLVNLFGAITLALACVGLYGLLAASVAGRTREIGVRMALGAGQGAVLRMILGQVAITAAAGLSIGLAVTWALTRVVESKLFGVKPHDPATLAIAAALVLLVSLAAAYWPVRRAMRIDPVRALRYE